MVYGGTQGWDLTSYSTSEGRKPVTDIGGALAYLYSSSNRWSLIQQAVRIAYKHTTLVIASVVVFSLHLYCIASAQQLSAVSQTRGVDTGLWGFSPTAHFVYLIGLLSL